MVTKDQAKEHIKKLVETFKSNIDQYQQASYKEAHVRKEFIDKFFVALGWDVYNDEGRSERYKEVINEDAIKIGGKTKAPDYAFRIGGTRIFFVEAKKPSINIKEDAEPAFQLRRYAWNSKIPLSILTDFEEFIAYDCRVKPSPKDGPAVARLFNLNFEEYMDKFDTIWDIFSKEAVLKGNFDRYVETSQGKKGTSEVDSEFLSEIEAWRDTLARNIALRNPKLSISELNYALQKTIDRILFLRICEDRNIEDYEKLKTIVQNPGTYVSLLGYFRLADEKYNSGIFGFADDRITEKMDIDDKPLKDIITSLYYPYSPYDFSVLNVEILGSVYERFLGKTVRLTSSHQAKVEEKPEVKIAGGVYYTPEFVVDYIVKETVGRLIEGKSPEEIEKIRILDPACGSGTFLVRAYSCLLDYHLNYYLGNPTKYSKEIVQLKENQWFLTTSTRKKILLNNIFGVDIDPQAVELTKLSLLLKVLENETKETVNHQMKLSRERALPDLDNNVRCGNSLVDSSYLKQTTLVPNAEELAKVNPFDWEDKQSGFGKAMKDVRFDVIIGNPPYVKEDVRKEIFDAVKRTNLKKYYQGKMDYWYFFTCKAIDLMKEGGLHSFIAQNNWITSDGASILRDKILSETRMVKFFDFNEFKVFKKASIQTMVFVLERRETTEPYLVDYYKILGRDVTKEELRNYLMAGGDGKNLEHSEVTISPKELIGKTITFTDPKINRIIDKIYSKGNMFLKSEDIGNGIDVLQDFVSSEHLEILKDSSISKGDGIFVLNKEEVRKLGFNKTELEKIKPYYTSRELLKYFGDVRNRHWIIYADKDVRSNISSYPNIKNHLDRFRKVLTSVFKPYGLHRPRERKFFEGEKILSLRKTKEVSFTYTDFPCYVSRAFLIIKSPDIDLKYLTGLLNSKLVNFWLYHKGKKQGEQLQVDKNPLMKLPIYKPNNKVRDELNTQDEISRTVDMIIETSKKLLGTKLASEETILRKQISTLEGKIDEMVYGLYEIAESEKREIEKRIGKN
ncbi:MAG: DNA methyltransferase [Promethearchaeati archaeon SRVP18_Atabeyarchaeia-1]